MDYKSTISVVMSGVGGQGIILSSDILAEVLLRHGFDVVKSEIHGMSQRGGSVFSFIRFSGDKVASPVPVVGSADLLLAFEKLEALRYLKYLKKKACAIVSELYLPPTPVSSGLVEDPFEKDDLFGKFKGSYRIYFFPFNEIAGNMGNPRVANVVALGVLNVFMEKEFNLKVSRELWFDVISSRVKKHYVELNFRAFEKGMEIGKKSLSVKPERHSSEEFEASQ